MRRAARRDAIETAVVDALRKAGCSVAYWGIAGAPDLVVGRAGQNWLMEVKQPLGPRGGSSNDGQHLNTLQFEWHQRWRGHVTVVRSAAEALEVIGCNKVAGTQDDRA